MDPAVAAAVVEAHRTDWGFVLAATYRITRDLDAAEDCVQDAYGQALTAWPASGIPDRPAAWLTLVARRRAMDLIRSSDRLRRRLPLLVDEETAPGAGEEAADAAQPIPDDRLRLIFTCCHPALPADARVALTLRLLCGLTTAEVARAFLVSEPTMAARITRAKKKIAAARIPYQVPPADELPGRLAAVTDVVHLLFTTGHTAPAGESLQRRELADAPSTWPACCTCSPPRPCGRRAARAHPAHRRPPPHPHHRRRKAAPACRARPHPLGPDRDRRRTRPGPHRPGEPSPEPLRADGRHRRRPRRSARWESTDWQQITSLYDTLTEIWPSPVVALNRAIAIGEARGPHAGLAALDQLATEPQLVGYHYLPAARADFLRRLHRADDARLAYHEALILATNPIERDFLTRRLGELDT